MPKVKALPVLTAGDCWVKGWASFLDRMQTGRGFWADHPQKRTHATLWDVLDGSCSAQRCSPGGALQRLVGWGLQIRPVPALQKRRIQRAEEIIPTFGMFVSIGYDMLRLLGMIEDTNRRVLPYWDDWRSRFGGRMFLVGWLQRGVGALETSPCSCNCK